MAIGAFVPMVPHASLPIVLAEAGVGTLQCLKNHLVLAESFIRINDFALINLQGCSSTVKQHKSTWGGASERAKRTKREREGEIGRDRRK